MVKKNTKKMTEASYDILKDIVGAGDASEIMKNMSPEPIAGYKKGKILTVGELKKLPANTIIHLWYEDEDGQLRNDDFVKLDGYKDGDDEVFAGGWSMPIEGCSDNELVECLDNSGWEFTVREAIKIN